METMKCSCVYEGDATRNLIEHSYSVSEVKTMKANRSLIAAVFLLAAGLGLIFGYCTGNTSMNVGYPVSGSILQVAVTTAGPAALGGVALTMIGVLLLAWAFLWAIIGEIGLINPAWYVPKRKEREVVEERAVLRKNS
jgi:hypothetical protein